MSTKVYVFPDIETTGLDAENDHILEIAWVFTDDQFQPLESHYAQSFIVDPGTRWEGIWSQLRANDVVRDMHQQSGLLADLENDLDSRILWQISEKLFDDIEKLPRDTVLRAAGFSVDFDLRFLRQIPHFAGLFIEGGDLALHYQQLNLSSIKLVLDSAGVDYPKPPKAHRALADVYQGIAFANWVRTYLVTALPPVEVSA